MILTLMLFDDPNSNAIDDPNSNAIDDPNSYAIDDPNSDVIDDPNSNAIDDPNSNAFDDPNSNAIDDPNSNAIDDPNSNVINDPNSDVIYETEPSSDDTSSDNSSPSDISLNIVPDNESITNPKDMQLIKGVFSNELTSVLSSWLKSEKKVPHASVDRLLLDFRKKDFDVPKSSKTLVSTEVTTTIMDSGQYFHSQNWMINMKCYAESFLKSELSSNVDKLNLMVNIDGLSLFNPLSISKYTCYPILVKYFEIYTS